MSTLKNWGSEMPVERARKSVGSKISRQLWMRSGGRCEYCNKLLYRDSLTERFMNKAYISHIVAAKEGFVRGDSKLSEELEVAFDNLMLLCDECHNRIDKADPARHPVEVLQKIKKTHEDRIELLTAIKPKNKSHILTFMAKIGEHLPVIDYQDAANTMLTDYYPASHRMVELGIENYPKEDDQNEYWQVLESTLTENFQTKVFPLLKSGEVNHFSVFGLAPQPLLIRLGVLLSDIKHVRVHTNIREPQTWKHPEDEDPLDFVIIEPEDKTGVPVLNISITADINESRIQSVLEEHASIWKLTVPTPGKDLVRSDATLQNFRKRVREIFERIKKAHGEDETLRVFPAMPNSTAIEFGRVWQPKAELPMIIFDQNRSRDGFIKTVSIIKPKRTQYES